MSTHREWLLIKLRTPWEVGGKTYAAGALLASDFEAFLKGERKFDVLFEPTERKSLAGHSPTRHHIILNELDNVRSRLYVLTHANGSVEARGAARPAEVRQRERVAPSMPTSRTTTS